MRDEESGIRRTRRPSLISDLSSFILPYGQLTADNKGRPMPLLVVGSVALDSVETPTETRENVLGGSAVFFSYAASYFTSVRLVGVVGEDWPAEHTALLQSRRIDTAGLQ